MGLKGDNISDRLLDFSVRVVKLAGALPKNQVGRHVCGQLLRAGTSAGANYEEARGAESRKDFIHKLGLALKEIRESHYWLKLVDRASLLPPTRMAEILKEADELTRIIAQCVITAKTHDTKENANVSRHPLTGDAL